MHGVEDYFIASIKRSKWLSYVRFVWLQNILNLHVSLSNGIPIRLVHHCIH